MQADYHELNKLLGNIDIYLFDQILKGLFPPHYKILDTGCNDGRNLIYFLRNNYEAYGIDLDEEAIQMLRHIARSIDKSCPVKDRFVVGDVKNMPFAHEQFDAIVSSAVMHFAESEEHFLAMFQELTRVLKPEGVLFVRMTTDLGMSGQIKSLGNGRYLLPDGSERFLLSKTLLQQVMSRFGYQLAEPFKTVIIENQRSMSAFILRKTTLSST
ncbi:MAG: class I SAM-dependent methyltransferase [Cyclobacteriaceae bacterium]|nr:class I SAM-dependent methyltransferase [Cyclobacteriaceae bacterium]